MRLLDERRPCFEEHNHFFSALLGLESLGQKLDVLLREHGTTRIPIDLTYEEIRHDEFLCAVLGLIAFRGRLAELLEAARHAPRQGESPPEGPIGTRSILR